MPNTSLYHRVLRTGDPTKVVAQYIWGARPGHRDELILRDRDTTGDGGLLDERLYCLMDYFNPVAVVDSAGEVQERYAWFAFGLRTALAPDWLPMEDSLFDWNFGFHGQFLDLETGYYNYGFRYYSPCLGRWPSKDPIQEQMFFERISANLTLKNTIKLRDESQENGFLFTHNNPPNLIDKLGLDVIVIIGWPIEGGDNPFGHAAISVTGYGTFSWGTEHPDGMSLNEYLEDQIKQRVNSLYWLKTTPEEDAAMVAAFKAERNKGYSVAQGRTCATAVTAALVAIGAFRNTTPAPLMLMRWFELGLSRRPDEVLGVCICKDATGLPLSEWEPFSRSQAPQD